MIHPIAILRIHTTNGFQLRFGAPLAQASSQATKAHAKSQPRSRCVGCQRFLLSRRITGSPAKRVMQQCGNERESTSEQQFPHDTLLARWFQGYQLGQSRM